MIFAFFGSCTVGTIDYIPLTLIKSDYKKLYNHNGLWTKQATIPDHLPQLCKGMIFAKGLTMWLPSKAE